MKKLTLVIALIGLFSIGMLPSAAQHDPDDGNRITDILIEATQDGEFGVLLAALEATGLDLALRDDDDFTVFAPTDGAFLELAEALDVEASDLLDRPDLADILLYHVVSASLDADAIRDAGAFASRLEIETLNGASIAVRIVDEDLFINDSEVIRADIQAANGVIHVIDSVLIPPERDNREPQLIFSTELTITDIVSDTVSNEDELGILLRALVATELDAVLADPDATFTVFAPTDDAFIELASALDIAPVELLDSPALADILLYHVVPANLAADDILGALGNNRRLDIQTVNGESIAVTVRGTDVFINDAQLITTDIAAANGVIHIIDAVLVPDNLPTTDDH